MLFDPTDSRLDYRAAMADQRAESACSDATKAMRDLTGSAAHAAAALQRFGDVACLFELPDAD